MKKTIEIIEINTDSTILAMETFEFMVQFSEWNPVHDCWQPVSKNKFDLLQDVLVDGMEEGDRIEISYIESNGYKNVHKTIIIGTLGFKYEPSNKEYKEITEW